MTASKPMPTVLQLVVNDVLLSYWNLPNFVDCRQNITAAIQTAGILGQMQEAARIDDAPRVLELLPWFIAALDCMSGDVLAEWLDVADTVKRAAMGAPLHLLPAWVIQKYEWVQDYGWQPVGSGRPYEKACVRAPRKPAPKRPILALVANNENRS